MRPPRWSSPIGAKGDARIFQPVETLHAPHLVDIEVIQVIRRMAGGGPSTAFCEAALQDGLDTPVQRYPHEPLLNQVGELRANFCGYAAAYIALAEMLGVALVTADARLSRAPGVRCRVDLVG